MTSTHVQRAHRLLADRIHITMSLEQRYAIKFCVLQKKTKSETVTDITKTYVEKALKKTAIYKWYNRFSDGVDLPKDVKRDGRPATSKNDKIICRAKSILDSDRRIRVRDLANKLDISTGSAYSIVTDKLNMRRVAARWVPRLLSSEHKEKRMAAATQFLQNFRKKGMRYLNKIVTVDETWVSTFDPETKQMSSVWKTPASPSPQKARVVRSAKKQMFIVFYDVRGVVLTHAVPVGTTITSKYYSKVCTVQSI